MSAADGVRAVGRQRLRHMVKRMPTALFAFIVYFNLLNLGQSWISMGRAGFGNFMLGLHGGVFLIAKHGHDGAVIDDDGGRDVAVDDAAEGLAAVAAELAELLGRGEGGRGARGIAVLQ